MAHLKGRTGDRDAAFQPSPLYLFGGFFLNRARSFVRWMLEQKGCAVIEAADGEQAVAAAVSQHPDLILMVLIRPVVDGFDAFRRVREHEGLRGVPVIAVLASPGSRRRYVTRTLSPTR